PPRTPPNRPPTAQTLTQPMTPTMASSAIQRKEIEMDGRTAWRVLIAVVLVAGAATLGVTAYQAGLAQGIAQTGTAVAPGAVAYYGWHPFGFGFGFFGFLGTLLFFVLIFALIRP